MLNILNINKIKKIYNESFFISLFNYILNIKAVRLFFDFKYISFVWKKSFFYKSLFFYVIKFLRFISQKGLSVKIRHVCIIVLYLICFPDISLDLSLSLVFGIMLFYIVSSVLKSNNDLRKIFSFIYISAVILCLYGFFINSVLIGELLIMIFPFAFLYSVEFNNGIRKYIYLSFIFISCINIIPSFKIKGVIIGFIAEVIVLIFTNIKYIPLLLMLVPLGLTSFINNIKDTWSAALNYGNLLNNIIAISQKVWNNGFGINRRKLMEIYYINENTDKNSLSLIFSDFGSLILIIFLVYILRIARSSFTSLFSADKEYKKIFGAGLSFLVGVSVLSFFEELFLSSRIMLVYWVIIGILRAVRRMNFTSPSLDKTSAV